MIENVNLQKVTGGNIESAPKSKPQEKAPEMKKDGDAKILAALVGLGVAGATGLAISNMTAKHENNGAAENEAAAISDTNGVSDDNNKNKLSKNTIKLLERSEAQSAKVKELRNNGVSGDELNSATETLDNLISKLKYGEQLDSMSQYEIQAELHRNDEDYGECIELFDDCNAKIEETEEKLKKIGDSDSPASKQLKAEISQYKSLSDSILKKSVLVAEKYDMAYKYLKGIDIDTDIQSEVKPLKI